MTPPGTGPRALSETEFEQVWVPDNQAEGVAIEFELDGDGRALSLWFTDEQNASLGKLDRPGDLPEGWQ